MGRARTPTGQTILVATTNAGKSLEYAALLQGLPCRLVTLRDAGVTQEVPETAHTMKANAVLKARGYAGLTGLLTIADDSGLEVDAMGGEPGVRSARYAGEGASDQDRCHLVLRRMAGVPNERRTARFRCVIAVATADGRVETSEGVCEGSIVCQPRGDNGFGYDPIFVLAGMDRHMAELDMTEKNRLSHRGQAMVSARPILERLLAEGSEAPGARLGASQRTDREAPPIG